jgi:uncharacterized protein (TIGR03083 family)
VPGLNPVDWDQARAALAEAVPRLTALLRSVSDPLVPAVGEWNVAELATHLVQAWNLVPSLALRRATSVIPDIWSLAGLTTAFVREESERNLGVLADHIDASAAAFLEATSSSDPDEIGPWLVEGTAVPLRVFACHLINETLVHGYDIARAAKRPWRLDRGDAGLILMGFVLPVLDMLGPRAMVEQSKAAGLRATYDVRLREVGQVYFVFEDGGVTLEPPSSRPVDCHISADPAAMVLVVWGRHSQWRAISRGQLLAWGRRPWLGVRLRGLIRNP